MFKTLSKIWNSKAMDTFGEVGYETIKFAAETSLVLTEAIVETFSSNNTAKEDTAVNNATYEYWSNLSYQEQKEYFEKNEYLNIYTNEFYEYDRDRTAKNMQKLADKMNREFTDKYSRY